MSYPTEYRYTKDHEWVHVEGNRAKIGITDHAQSELGDVVFVELPTVGTEAVAGENVASVESVKAVGDVAAPLAGRIAEVNAELESSPEKVNEAPHTDGWIFVLEVADPAAAEGLLDAASYERFLAEG